MRKSYFVCVIIASNGPVRAATVNWVFWTLLPPVSLESGGRLTESDEVAMQS